MRAAKLGSSIKHLHFVLYSLRFAEVTYGTLLFFFANPKLYVEFRMSWSLAKHVFMLSLKIYTSMNLDLRH